MNGDFYDLERKLKRADDPETPRDHCSGFVKVAPGNNDLFVSQVSFLLLKCRKLDACR